MKKFKILHISDMHLRHNGRLFYSTGKKINNGLILNGHNVLHLSDRDITNQTKNIFDIGGKKYLFNSIIKTIENFKPDLILFGHVDRLDEDNFLSLKEKYNSIKFSQWFLDPVTKHGPDYNSNKNRFLKFIKHTDANFITTDTYSLDFNHLLSVRWLFLKHLSRKLYLLIHSLFSYAPYLPLLGHSS